jgi:hypothetical protein
MRLHHAVTLLVTTLLIWNCSGIPIKSEYSSDVNFRRLVTYRWAQLKGSGTAFEKASAPEKLLMTGIDKALAAKGYEKLEAGTPDFYLLLFDAAKEKAVIAEYKYTHGKWWGEGPYGPRIDVEYYREGTAFVDIVQKIENVYELVWRGAGLDVLKATGSPGEAQANADAAAEKILKNFPPTPTFRMGMPPPGGGEF